MLRRRWTVCAMTALLFGGTAAAQEPGSLLVGGFGQYTYFSSDYGIDNGFDFGKLGFGGRIGAFMTPTTWLEAEGSYTSLNRAAPATGNMKYGPISARMMFKFPSTTGISFHAGAGASLFSLRPDEDDRPVRGTATYNYGVEGAVGMRFGFGGLNLRIDGIGDYYPTPAAYTLRAQAGLEFWPNIASWFGPAGGTMTNLSAPWAPVVWWDELTAPLPGTLEIGGFAQVTQFGDNAGREGTGTARIQVENDLFGNIGFGGRMGVFLSDPRWQVEGDGAYMEVERENDPRPASAREDIKYSTFALRMNYNIPVMARSQLILGGGVVRTNYNFGGPGDRVDFTYNYGASGLVGLRFGIANRTALRIDGVADYMPTPENLNLSARLGLSFLLGGMRREVMCTYAGLENVPASSPACVPPPPPPPPPAMCPIPGLGNILASDPACVSRPVVVVDTAAITGPIYFDYDKSTIRPDAEATLQRKLPWLRANPGMRIRIEGNADERGSDEYNIALGQRRAAAAKAWLVQNGIDASRFDLVSYGEERPVCQEHDESCWQLNRRDDFVIVTIGSDNIVVPSGMED